MTTYASSLLSSHCLLPDLSKDMLNRWVMVEMAWRYPVSLARFSDGVKSSGLPDVREHKNLVLAQL